MLGLFASVLLHELAHAAVGAWFKIRTLEIVMFPIGGLSRMERRLRPVEELWISLAGPAGEPAGGVWHLLVHVASTKQTISVQPSDLLHPSGGKLLPLFGFANLLLAGFNLVPAFPMDGGRLLRALLSSCAPRTKPLASPPGWGAWWRSAWDLYGLVAGEFMLVFFAFFIWLGAAQESAAAHRADADQRNSGARRDDHRIPHSGTRRHRSRRRESAALHLAAGFSGDARRRGDRTARPQFAAEGARPRKVRTLTSRASWIATTSRSSPPPTWPRLLPLMARPAAARWCMDGSRLVGLLTTDNLSEFLLLRRFGMEPVV